MRQKLYGSQQALCADQLCPHLELIEVLLLHENVKLMLYIPDEELQQVCHLEACNSTKYMDLMDLWLSMYMANT